MVPQMLGHSLGTIYTHFYEANMTDDSKNSSALSQMGGPSGYMFTIRSGLVPHKQLPTRTIQKGDMAELSRDEAQTTIYRGCARLAEAMQIERVAKDAAQRWEDGVLQEVRDLLSAATKVPLAELDIPPLPLALVEVYKSLQKRRPLRPSDIHSPAEQARSSPWAIWTTPEDDSQIPSHISLGDPSTFWWKDVEEKVTKTCAPDDEDSEDMIEDSRAVLDSRPVEVQRHSPPASEPSSGERPPKRYREDPPSEEEGESPYFYNPQCDNCKRHNWICRAVRSGYACTDCRIRKLRCSARGESYAVKRNDASMANPVDKKPRVVEKSKSIVELLRSPVATRPSEGETAPTMTERKEMRSVPCPPSEHQREVFIAVPPSTSKPCARPLEQPLKYGPPRGKRKQKQAARTPSHNSSESTPVLDTRTIPCRVLVDKSVATENVEHIERFSHQQAEVLKALASFIMEVAHLGRP